MRQEHQGDVEAGLVGATMARLMTMMTTKRRRRKKKKMHDHHLHARAIYDPRIQRYWSSYERIQELVIFVLKARRYRLIFAVLRGNAHLLIVSGAQEQFPRQFSSCYQV